MNELVARRLEIRGRVQGVWFRESMRIEAESLGVTGWVRNRLDGSVEALIEGEFHAVETLTRWARRGPERASVDAVAIRDEPAAGLDAFEKRPTA